jgi:glycosyltransferase involved in cell wall biosynthesis
MLESQLALAQGTAVVATHNTPWSALSQAGIGAWVAADAKAIAAATSALIEASSAMEDWVQRAQADARRAFVAEHYAWDVVERKMTAFYREVRGKASGQA